MNGSGLLTAEPLPSMSSPPPSIEGGQSASAIKLKNVRAAVARIQCLDVVASGLRPPSVGWIERIDRDDIRAGVDVLLLIKCRGAVQGDTRLPKRCGGRRRRARDHIGAVDAIDGQA